MRLLPIALGLSAGALFGCGQAPSSTPDPGAAEAAGVSKYGHDLLAESREFRVFSDLPLDGSELLRTCEETYTRVSRWIDDAEGARRPAVDVFLVAEGHEIALLERKLSVTSPVHPSFRAGDAGGGYYERVRCILLQVSPHPAQDLPLILSHEVCHVALRDACGDLPAAVEEGLAELLPHWALHGPAEPDPARVDYRDPEHEATCAELLQRGELPGVAQLLQLGGGFFGSHRTRNQALAWSLLQLLVTADDSRLAGRLPRYLRSVRSADDSWGAFRESFDVAAVEEAWRRRISTYARK